MSQDHEMKDCKMSGKICIHCSKKNKHSRFQQGEDQMKPVNKTTEGTEVG